MASVGWLADASEESLRAALAKGMPELGGLTIRINARLPSSNPLWWSSSAVIDDAAVVKFAWSEVRAVRLWREGVVLQRLRKTTPSLAVPDVLAVTTHPALVATGLVQGVPLGGEWAWELSGPSAVRVAEQLGAFLSDLHGVDVDEVLNGLPTVIPTAQADTTRLRRRFPRLVDEDRAAWVLRWCEWVDGILGADGAVTDPVLVHGDLHGYNQVWDRDNSKLAAVVDFEESGAADFHFDFRYLPGNARTLELLLATAAAYERLSGRPVALDRVMAWNVLTVLGDALWRTESRVALPGGGTAATWVDDLDGRLRDLDLI